VALLGSRQVGKTSLALQIGRELPSLYLDLEATADRARLAEPALWVEVLGLAQLAERIHRPSAP